MTIHTKYTPYFVVISVPTEDGKVLELSLSSSADKQYYYANINLSSCAYSLIAVPVTLFELNGKIHLHYSDGLEERITLTPEGTNWKIDLAWESEGIKDSCIISNQSMHHLSKELQQLCGTPSKVGTKKHKGALTLMQRIFSLPTKLLNL